MSATDDEGYMRRCLEFARQALADGEVGVGALVVRDGRVIGTGYERTRTRLDPAAHAEVEACRAACAALGTLDLSGATLYTTVEPCVLCAYVIRHTRIIRVVFGVHAGALGGMTGPIRCSTMRCLRPITRWRRWRAACSRRSAGRS
jgi:tRNA(adenine34) deaminase